MKKIPNSKLKGFMAQYAITQNDLSKVLGIKPQAISLKINKCKFRQSEMKKLVEFLSKYDEVDMNIFA